ncbi:MAG TPA: aldo/keto reductase [Candidatus Limnocylindrales bacterium]|jgi:D-threo-aldose 1-dehydrogenase
MPYEPTERLPIGTTGLTVTRLGLGGASIGGLYREVTDADAAALVRHAWRTGVRYFDTAPLYGYGTSERRMGRVLAGEPRDAFVLSTKVGRLVREAELVAADADLDRQDLDGRENAYYRGVETRRMVFDYSARGVTSSIEESLDRLGLERIDIAYIHDPDRHWQAAIEDAYPALERLRSEGRLRAIGVGMNQARMLARFARDGDFDVLLVANRYTLLDQAGLDELLPICERRGISVAIGGVMNSGILADPSSTAHFDYRPAPTAMVERARRLADICSRHGVPLRTAAIQFPLAHPAVVSVVAGVRSTAHLDEYPAAMRAPIPADLWAELRSEGLLHPAAPTPA